MLDNDSADLEKSFDIISACDQEKENAVRIRTERINASI